MSGGAGTDTLDLRVLFSVLADYQRGNFTVRMPDDRTGLAGKICDALNTTIERNERLVKELERLSTVVGKAGNVKQRAQLPSAEGAWSTAVESVNTLVSDLVQPTTEVARVIGAVAKGDLTQTMSLEIDDRPLTGEFLRTAKVVNTMVAQLGTFSSEVTRVAREVGTEGKLGGQAVVKGVAGTWKDLTDNVNLMAANLTSQVRNIAEVTTAVAKGDLSKKVTVDVKGEILELKNTVNTMVDQLQLVRRGSDARREGSRHRRTAGRPGRRARCGRHVEGPHRQRQRAGVEPDGAAARRVEGRDRDRQRRPESEDHGAGAGRNSADQERASTRWWTSSVRSPRK